MSIQAKGSKASVQIDFETIFGTTNATPASIRVPINTSQLKSKQNLIDPATITGRRDPVEPAKGNIDVSGTIVVPLDANNIGFWLKAAFGAPTTTGSAVPYTHVFKVGDTQPSLSIQQAFTDIGQYELFNGVKISKMKFSFGGDGELTVSIDVIGAKETLGTTSFDASPKTIVLARLSNFQAAIKEGGSTIAVIRNVDIEIDMGLDGDTYVIGGQGFRGAVNEGIMQVSGNLKALFTDQTLLAKAVAGTQSSIDITVTNGSYSLEINLPELVYERNSPGIDGPKGVQVELPFKAYYKAAAANSCVVFTLNNDEPSYA
jgi:hypothetical protein